MMSASQQRCYIRFFGPRSINQSDFYSANIPTEARFSSVTAKSKSQLQNPKTSARYQRDVRHAGAVCRKGQMFSRFNSTIYERCGSDMSKLDRKVMDKWTDDEQSTHLVFYTWTTQKPLLVH